MKRFVIISIATLSIIGGSVFIMNKDIKETEKPVEYIDWNKPPEVSSETTFTETKPVEQPVIVDSDIVEGVTYPTLEDLMHTRIPSHFRVQIMLYRLKYKYPERFMPSKIEESFNYVISKFDLTQQMITDDVIRQVEFNLGW